MTAFASLVANAVTVDATAGETGMVPFTITGDAILAPLAGAVGDVGRGRAIVTDRRVGLCLLCHDGPFPEERFKGTLAPSLAGVGDRWSTGQLRLRIVDPRRLDPATLMPAYYAVEGQTRVADAFVGKPILAASEIEDVVAFLATLRTNESEVAP